MTDFAARLARLAHPIALLRDAITLLGEMGANECGDLTHAQAALLHNAARMLQDLEEDLTEDDE